MGKSITKKKQKNLEKQIGFQVLSKVKYLGVTLTMKNIDI